MINKEIFKLEKSQEDFTKVFYDGKVIKCLVAPYHTAEYFDEDEGDEYAYWSVVRDKRFYAGRNYYLFTILAGVRGNRDDESISEPRGVPDDISDAYREQLRQWEGDAHSKSYFTLKELLDVDWSKYETEYIPEFFETIEKMKQLDTDPEKVRCLFFFDN